MLKLLVARIIRSTVSAELKPNQKSHLPKDGRFSQTCAVNIPVPLAFSHSSRFVVMSFRASVS